MTGISFFPQNVSLRRIALPVEHGGWGIVLEPVVLGLIVAPSASGVLIGLAALLTFLARQPFRIASGDLVIRRESFPRTNPALLFAIGYGFGAALLVILAVFLSGRVSVVVPIAIAAPLAGIQIACDVRNVSRSVLPELSGATAMSASAAAILLAGGQPWSIAIAAWLLIAARSISAILYVRARLRRDQRREWRATPTTLAHVLALSAAIVATTVGLAPALSIVVFLLLAIRAANGLTRRIGAPDARRVGWMEIVWGIVTVVAIGAGWRIGL